MNTKILLSLFLCICFTAGISLPKTDDSLLRFARQYDDDYADTDQDSYIIHMVPTKPVTTDAVTLQTSTEVEEITTVMLLENHETSTIDVMNEDIETSTSLPLLVIANPEVLHVQHGQTVELTCMVYRANPQTRVVWIQKEPERRVLLTGQNNRQILSSGIRLTTRITLDDSSKIGVYQCLAHDGTSFIESNPVTMYENNNYIFESDDYDTVTVRLTPIDNHNYLHIVVPHMVDGDYVDIQCEGASSSEHDRIEWYFNNKQIIEDQQPFFPRGMVLHIRPISKSYLGTYRCTIPNTDYTDGSTILTYEDVDTNNSSPSSCECCSSSHCRSQSSRCSTNTDCQCLTMTMTGRGICADTIISCKKLHLCEKDNLTCSTPNTVCVNNSRCNQPVCYPLERASINSCPPLPSQTVIISKNISSTICNRVCYNNQTCVNGNCVGPENLVISATWSISGDGDLIVTTPNGKTINSINKYANIATDYGALDNDVTIGTGPEKVFWEKDNEPPHGTYHICFWQYGLSATIANPITVTIVVQNRFGVINTYIKTFTTRNDPTSSICAPNLNTYIVSITYP